MVFQTFSPSEAIFKGLSDADQAAVRDLLAVWNSRYYANWQRSLYYDTEQAFRDLGIAVPPQLKRAKFYLGWPTQAVAKPARRTQLSGVSLPGADDPFELAEVFAANRFEAEFGQAVLSAYTHGMSLLTVALDGDRQVQIQGHSAENCAAIWDPRTRGLEAALTISSRDDYGPKLVTVWLPDKVIVCQRGRGDVWETETQPNRVGRVLAVPVLNDPQLRKPLGRSRITRSVMALTDTAIRTYVRMEANAELYSAPQIALLGISDDAFEAMSESKAKRFQMAVDRVLGFTKDADGDRPTLQQLSQASMQPHSDMLRTVAMAFSGETGIPPSSLGIIHDQPASAEAIRAAEHDMLVDVTYHNRFVHSASVRQVAELAVMVRDGLHQPPAGINRLSVQFVDPEFRSLSAQADAVQKLAADMPNLAQWDVLLEQVFDADQVARIKSAQRRAEGKSLIDQLVQVNKPYADEE